MTLKIEEANERNDHIFLDLDVSQIIPGQRCFANLVSFLSGAYAIFGTKYGSIDTKFSKNGEKEINIPEGTKYSFSSSKAFR